MFYFIGLTSSSQLYNLFSGINELRDNVNNNDRPGIALHGRFSRDTIGIKSRIVVMGGTKIKYKL